jgi:hypothetical protein
MKIIVNPQWSFIEALEAAWEAYRGGLQHGVPNRIRVLEQWANVVGRHRAVAELEETLAAYKDSAEVEKYLGLSSYTVSRLRKQFKAMPVVTPFALESNNSSALLRQSQEKENDISNIDAALSQFLKLARESESDPLFMLIVGLARENTEITVNESTLRQLLEISQKAGMNVIARLIDWMTTVAKAEDVVAVLEKLNADNLQKLNAAVGLSNLKNVLDIWRNNTKNDNEEFWQEVLVQNSFLFAQLFSYPVIILEDKAYVGGKSISNKGGNVIDFICTNNLTRNAALVEIKTPTTKLLGSKYRGDIYNISSELSGSTIQVTNYKNSLMQNYVMLVNAQEGSFEAFDPECVVIIGNIASELADSKQRKSLELFRMGLKDVQVITYDELFGKVEFLVSLLEGNIDGAAARSQVTGATI